jgi:hypothetical protein
MADMQRGPQTSALADGGQSAQETGEAFCDVFNSVERRAESRPADAPPADTAANTPPDGSADAPPELASGIATAHPPPLHTDTATVPFAAALPVPPPGPGPGAVTVSDWTVGLDTSGQEPGRAEPVMPLPAVSDETVPASLQQTISTTPGTAAEVGFPAEPLPSRRAGNPAPATASTAPFATPRVPTAVADSHLPDHAAPPSAAPGPETILTATNADAADPRTAPAIAGHALHLALRENRVATAPVSETDLAETGVAVAGNGADVPLSGSFAEETSLVHQPAETRRTAAGGEVSGPLHRGAPDAPPPPERQIVAAILSSGSGRTDILLEPEDLGRVRLSLEGNESGIVVTIVAERSETADLLRRHADLLLEEFREAGYADLTFSFADRGQPADPPPREDDIPRGTSAEPTVTVTPAPSTQPSPRGTALLDMRL